MKDIDVTDTKQQISSLNSENSLSYGHFKNAETTKNPMFTYSCTAAAVLKNCFLVRKHWISGSKLCLKQSFEPIIDALPIIQSDSGRFPYVSINALYGILR